MNYLISLFMVAVGYYTITYGVHLWKNENNKLGSVGTIIIAVVGTMVPIIVLFLKG